MTKRPLALLLLLFLANYSYAGETDDEREAPSYRELMIKNTLVPGLGMSMLGNKEEARIYFVALPLRLAGAGLTAAAVFMNGNGIVAEIEHLDGATRLFGYKYELSTVSRLMLLGGTGLSLYGSLLAAYSNYAVHSDYVGRYGMREGDAGRPQPRISMAAVLAAPFTPAHVFTVDVLPIIGLSTLSGFSIEDYGNIGGYFRRDRVRFLGYDVKPFTGLGLQVLLACGFVTANAAWEELAYRGLGLQLSGAAHSSLSFGFAHLANMLVPGVTVEGALLQTLTATAFGFYAADRVQRGENGLERMIALHFWNNVLVWVLGYLADPESDRVLSVAVRF